MNKSWITKAKWSCNYRIDVNNFLEFASPSHNSLGKILCPYKPCINRYFHSMKGVKDHLISKEFFTGYVLWNRHGEEHYNVVEGVMNETFIVTFNLEEAPVHTEHNMLNAYQPNDDREKFAKLMPDVGVELYHRFFLVLKDYVCKKHSHKGSIVVGFIDEFSNGGIPLGKVMSFVLDNKYLVKAHRYVLCCCDDMTSYRECFKDGEKRKKHRQTQLMPSDVEKLVNEKFIEWLCQTISMKALSSSDYGVTYEIKALIKGPNKVAQKYKGIFIKAIPFTQKPKKRIRKLKIMCDWDNISTTGMKEDQFRHPFAELLMSYLYR
ncbi:hypothetical protein M5K25_017885 [Dendrobium thyrsiflorum]|uniref:Transposase-associated domain-containing protein n=1 Tax=Dendrobium thyrsiflorum TaxID=117978 RepID=A0ABD0UNK5_DENTH